MIDKVGLNTQLIPSLKLLWAQQMFFTVVLYSF